MSGTKPTPVDVDSLAALGWAFRVLHRHNVDIPTAIAAAASVGIEEGLHRDEIVVAYAQYLESRLGDTRTHKEAKT